MWNATLKPGSLDTFDVTYSGKPPQKMTMSGKPNLSDFCIGRYDSGGNCLGRLFIFGGALEAVNSFIYAVNIEIDNKEDVLILDGIVVGIQRENGHCAVCVETTQADEVLQSTYVVPYE